LDGYGFHGDPHAFERDRDHDADGLALDLVTTRITSGRLQNAAEREARRLHRILEARRR
jgi:hypothetical protein